jgi:hypothetical protein
MNPDPTHVPAIPWTSNDILCALLNCAIYLGILFCLFLIIIIPYCALTQDDHYNAYRIDFANIIKQCNNVVPYSNVGMRCKLDDKLFDYCIRRKIKHKLTRHCVDRIMFAIKMNYHEIPELIQRVCN